LNITSLITDPTTSAQEVSGFVIAFHDPIGAVTFAPLTGQTVSGGLGHQLVNVNSDHSFTVVSGNPTHWQLGTVTSSSVQLQTRSNGPTNLIVGSAGSYPSTNNGFDNFNPYIQGTGTFLFSASTITATEIIDALSIEFGTQPELVQGATIVTPNNPVPEPRSVALLLTGLLGLAAVRRSHRV
jgi:hypothetical protein